MNREKQVTVSFRIAGRLHEQMKLQEEVNWSAVVRKSLEQTVQESYRIDRKRAEAACRGMDELRKAGAFSKGKSAVEVVREWRDKR